MTPSSKLSRRRYALRRFLVRSSQLVLCVGAVLSVYIAITSYRYGVSLPEAAEGVLRSISLSGIRGAVFIYDPCEPRFASTGPDLDNLPNRADYGRVEQVLPSGHSWVTPSGRRIMAQTTRNEVISRSPFVFRYQPFDESRLHELRRKYRLDEVVAPATNEFEAMVLLRNWTRSQFRRRDYQPVMGNFDALEILERNWRDHGELYSPGRHMDPCYLFPMLYCQVLLSMGHQVRLVSVEHGMAEVWSNLHRKWFVTDVELNHHFEKAGVPLNLVELSEEHHNQTSSSVRLVRGHQSSGDENTTMVHLKIEKPTAQNFLPMFGGALDVADMRNDWMTNHYFRGHPARSEANSLVFMHPKLNGRMAFRNRGRPVTADKKEFYWTLNQTEIWMTHPTDDVLELAFNTVTPNFEYFDVVVDDNIRTALDASTFQWRLHEGVNSIVVRAVNRFGVRGIESAVQFTVSETRR